VKEIGAIRETLADKVYEAVRTAIMVGDLAPGSLHSVQMLSSRLKVSRTPVREALLKLADQGMVRFERNRGARILQTTVRDLEEIFSLRLLLEVPATYRAAERIGQHELRQLSSLLENFHKAIHSLNTREHLELDASFHRIILRASGNRRLADFIDGLRDLQMVRGFLVAPKARDLNEICADHERIYQRILDHDPTGAAIAMRDHLSLSSRLLIAEEGGDQADTGKFAPTWIDVIELQQRALKEHSPAWNSGLAQEEYVKQFGKDTPTKKGKDRKGGTRRSNPSNGVSEELI
jgi:DNA-binding GntR family transcriptional regulator